MGTYRRSRKAVKGGLKMAEYIEREAVLRYLKECGECKLISIIVRDIEDMPYFVKGEIETTLEVNENE